MSVRFRLVNMFEASVSIRLPIVCQKYSTRRGPPPRNREP